MKKFLAAVIICLQSTMASSQAIECTTVLECAQVAADTAAVMQQAVTELEAKVSALEGQVATLQSELAAERAARVADVQAINGKFPGYVPYGAAISLKSPEGFLHSYNRRNRDELDVLISGANDQFSKWTVGQ